jgi:hypothetical protein
MNRFQIRQQLRQLKASERRKEMHAVQGGHIDQVISIFEEAYIAYFSRKPVVRYKAGWYRVKWLGNFREHNLLAMANKMWAELHEEAMADGNK